MSAVRGFGDRFRAIPYATPIAYGLLLAFLIALPFLFDSGSPFIDDCILALTYVVMALGLNVIVGFAGLLDLGYVAFFAIGAFTIGWLGSGFFSGAEGGTGFHLLVGSPVDAATGHPPQLPADPRLRGGLHDDGRDRDRAADSAPARRLHRDRHPRLRRDHRPRRDQRERGPDRRDLGQHLRAIAAHPRHRVGGDAHRGAPGHHARRQDRLTLPGPLRGARPAPLVPRRARARRARDLRDLPPARLAPGPRLDRAARGRGRRRQHGYSAGADEARRLRARRRLRRARRRLPGFVPEHGERRPVPVLVLDLRARDGDPRRARLDQGRDRRCGPALPSSTTG